MCMQHARKPLVYKFLFLVKSRNTWTMPAIKIYVTICIYKKITFIHSHYTQVFKYTLNDNKLLSYV